MRSLFNISLSLAYSSSSALLKPSHPRDFHRFYFLTCLDSKISQYSMEKINQDGVDGDRERQYKEASNFGDRNRISDDILPHILNLYGSRATPHDFQIYAPCASFEDPLMCAKGVKQIKSAFYSLSKVFSESRIVEYEIKENIISPGIREILIDNKQYYKILGKDINMISLIKLYVEGGKVVRHEDWWAKKPLWNRESVSVPLVGRMMELTRRASMFATHAMMGFGKDPTV